MKLHYFTGIKTVEELNKARRDLLFIHHPDRNNGSEEKIKIAQKINAEYEFAKNKIENPVKRVKKPTQNDSKQENSNQMAESTAQSVIVEPQAKKERFFTPEHVDAIAKTASKLGNALFKGLAGGLAKKYNNG